MTSFRWALLLVLMAPSSDAETYRYDRAGRLTEVVYEDGNIVRYTYDANSNITQLQVLGDPLFGDGFE